MNSKLSIQGRELNNQLDRIYGTDAVSLYLLNPSVHIAILYNQYFNNTHQKGIYVICKTDIERVELAKDIIEEVGGKYKDYTKLYLATSSDYSYLLTTFDNRFSLITSQEVINLQKLLTMWNKATEEIKKEIKTKINLLLLDLLDKRDKRVVEATIKVSIIKTKEVSNAPVVKKGAIKKTVKKNTKKANGKKSVRRAK